MTKSGQNRTLRVRLDQPLVDGQVELGHLRGLREAEAAAEFPVLIVIVIIVAAVVAGICGIGVGDGRTDSRWAGYTIFKYDCY